MLEHLEHAQRVRLHVREKTRLVPQKGGGYTTVVIGFYLEAYDPKMKPKRVWRALGTKDKREAYRRFELLVPLIKSGKINLWASSCDLTEHTQALTLAAAVGVFLADLEVSPRPNGLMLRASTQEEYRKVLKQFVAHAEKRSCVGVLLRDVGEPVVTRFVFGRGLKPGTQGTVLSRVRGFFRWCVETGRLHENPAGKLRRPRSSGRITYFKPNEYEAFLNWLSARAVENEHLYPDSGLDGFIGAVILGTEAGLRRGEICALTWRSIDLANELIHVRNTETFQTKTGLSRTVPMSDRVRDLLTRLAVTSTSLDAPVLPGTKKGPLNPGYLSTTFKRLAPLAGLSESYSFHTTRHTYATWLARNATPIQHIQHALGHRSVLTTQIYTHLTGVDLAPYVQRTFRRAA
jgi:integrase/recombinase XerC